MAKLVVDQVDLAGKRVFLRADFNVPLDGARVTDDTRITAVLPTLSSCLDRGASVVLASHLGRPKGKADPKYSLRPVAERLQALLGRPVPLLSDCVGPEVEERVRDLKPGEVVLLENLRYHSEEEANDEGFARSLAGLAEVYVDDAFAAAHRAHASIAAITRFLRPAAKSVSCCLGTRQIPRVVLNQSDSPSSRTLATLSLSRPSAAVNRETVSPWIDTRPPPKVAIQTVPLLSS